MNFKSLKTQFIGAIAMVLVAAIAMGSSTYAWFAMNTEVRATNMTVQAIAENGIIISNVLQGSWSSSANAQVNSATALLPTSHGIIASTDDGWYHNSSKASDDAIDYASTTYTDLTTDLAYTNVTSGNHYGIGYIEGGTGTGGDEGYAAAQDKAYHLKNTFFIKTSAEAMSDTNLIIKNVSVASGGTMIKLDNALRVAIVAGGHTYIYAPITGAGGSTPTYTYHVKDAAATGTATVAYKPDAATPGGSGTGAYLAGANLACEGVTSIPAYSSESPIQVDIYVYYEGEDANCKSTNINGVTVDELTVSVDFTTAPVPTP